MNPLITTDHEHDAAVERMIHLERQPDSLTNPELLALADAVEAYEVAAGHKMGEPDTLRGILEVEMFKRRMRQRQLAELLEVSEPRLSDLMTGKRELNFDFARRLYTKLQIPADVILNLKAA